MRRGPSNRVSRGYTDIEVMVLGGVLSKTDVAAQYPNHRHKSTEAST
jgi:hypothetical protein